jgi:hypothetical protein
MKTYGGVDVWIHVFLISKLVGGERSVIRLGRFTPLERTPGTHWIGGLADPRTDSDKVEKRIFYPTGTPTPQSSCVVIVYTDCAPQVRLPTVSISTNPTVQPLCILQGAEYKTFAPGTEIGFIGSVYFNEQMS